MDNQDPDLDQLRNDESTLRRSDSAAIKEHLGVTRMVMRIVSRAKDQIAAEHLNYGI